MDAFVDIFKYATVIGIISLIILRPAAFVRVADVVMGTISDMMRIGGSNP